MDQVERGFNMIASGMRGGTFTKREMEFIIQMCQALINDTRKVLDRGPVKISADSGAGEHISQHDAGRNAANVNFKSW
jgi:hypothetical protein